MLNVPENLSGAVNRQTVLTINTKKVMEPLSSHSIGNINNMSRRNPPPIPALRQLRLHLLSEPPLRLLIHLLSELQLNLSPELSQS